MSIRVIQIQRGFTLIELLVVIAIIGILASVVLSSLSRARENARDAAIQSGLLSVRSQAAVYHLANGNYGNTGGNSSNCGGGGGTIFYNADPTTSNMLLSIRTTNNNAGIRCASGVGPSGQTYAIAVRLVAKDAWLCIDNDGTAKEIPGSAAPVLRAANASDPAFCP